MTELYVGIVATLAALIGAGVGAVRRHRLERGQILAAAYLAASATFDLLVYTLGVANGNAQPIARVWYLASVIFSLEALAAFQHDQRRVFAMRVLVVAYAVSWTIFAVAVEDFNDYSPYAAPLSGVVILAAALWTMFRRVAIARRDLATDHGFLTAVALGSIGMIGAFQSLLVLFWGREHASNSAAYYIANNSICFLAALLIIYTLRPAPRIPAPA